MPPAVISVRSLFGLLAQFIALTRLFVPMTSICRLFRITNGEKIVVSNSGTEIEGSRAPEPVILIVAAPCPLLRIEVSVAPGCSMIDHHRRARACDEAC